MAKFKSTPAELEILKIIWENGPSSVRDIHNALSKEKTVFYTTTLKTMQVMTTKGLLSRDTSSRSHVYDSIVSQKDAEQSMIGSLVNNVFSGSTAQLIISAIGHQKPKPEELEQIKLLIEKLGNDE